MDDDEDEGIFDNSGYADGIAIFNGLVNEATSATGAFGEGVEDVKVQEKEEKAVGEVAGMVGELAVVKDKVSNSGISSTFMRANSLRKWRT